MRHSSSVSREEEAKEGFKTGEEIKTERSGEDGKREKEGEMGQPASARLNRGVDARLIREHVEQG